MDREKVKQASRDLLASIKTRLVELDRFWEKEQTKAEVEIFILDEVYASLPTPPLSAEEKQAVAEAVYGHNWQQAVSKERLKNFGFLADLVGWADPDEEPVRCRSSALFPA